MAVTDRLGPCPRRPVPSGAAALGAVARVLLAAACWALAAVVAKAAFGRGVPPVRMAEARVAVALAALAPLLAWRRPGLLRPPPGTLVALAAFGVCVAAVNYCYYLAIDHLAVGVAIALQYTGPSLLLAAVALWSRRAPALPAWLAAAATLAGALLVSRAVEGLGAVDLVGLAAGLGAALSFSLYLVSAERAAAAGAAPATVLLWGFVVAVAVWAVAAPWWGWPVAALRDPLVVAAVLGVGLVGTLLPFLLTVGAVRVIGAAPAGIVATFEPVCAATLAWLLLGQRLDAAQVAGGVLVVGGVVLAQLVAARRLRADRRRPADPATKVEVMGRPSERGSRR